MNAQGPVSEKLLRSQIRAEIEADVTRQIRVELAEQWIKERDALILKIDQMIQAEVEKLRK